MMRRSVCRLGFSHGFGTGFDATKGGQQAELYEGPWSSEKWGAPHNDQEKYDRMMKERQTVENEEKFKQDAIMRSREYNADGERNAPLPPAIPHDPIQPIDFNPHLEVFEFPKEIFDFKFPYTRETNLLAFDTVHESSVDEMAHRYGIRMNATPRILSVAQVFIAVFLSWYLTYSCYRTQAGHKHWNSYAMAVAQCGDAPTIDENDLYLDWWYSPILRHSRRMRADGLVLWKPLMKENAEVENSWSVKFEHKDPSEWRHMVSKH